MSLRSEALARSHAFAGGTEARVVALDGLRGFMTILVVLSHYFAELPNGIPVLMAGWVAVDMFFVLSGYLVGRMILEKKHSANFLQVFFMRRWRRWQSDQRGSTGSNSSPHCAMRRRFSSSSPVA